MPISETYLARNQTRYFDLDNIPTKAKIEEILMETYNLCPSKQNLMPYKMHILGPDQHELKRQIYVMACEVEYPDEKLRDKWRLSRLKEHEKHFPPNRRFPTGNSQLFAPWVIIFEPRAPVPNKLVEGYLKPDHDMDYIDIRTYDGGQSKVEIGMFGVLLSGVVVDHGLNCAFTACLKSKEFPNVFEWSEKPPLLAISIGYPHPLVQSRYLYNKEFYKDAGEDKPDVSNLFNWM